MRRALLLVLAFAGLLSACTGTGEIARIPAPEADDPAAAPVPAEPVRITVWSSKQLPQAIAVAAAKIDGVKAVAMRRSGTLNLLAVVGAAKPLAARPPGSVLPVSVEMQDARVLAVYDRFAGAAAALARGEAVVPASTATLRGVEAGDAFDIGNGRRRARVRIGVVVPDDRWFRSEVIVPPATAEALDLGSPRGIVMVVDPDRSVEAEAALTRAVGTFPARIRSGTPAGPSAPAVPGSQSRLLSLAELKTIFGEFWYRPRAGRAISIDPAWSEANIATVTVPVLGSVRCHRAILPQLQGAMLELQSRGLAHLVRTNDGCYNPRMQVSNDEAISRHAFGVAIDINAGTNGYGAASTQDPRLVEIMQRWGFIWGGTWTVPDAMHFEFGAFPAAGG